MKISKKIIAVLCVICMCPSLVAFASDDQHIDVNDAVIVISTNDEIGFALYKEETENDLKDKTLSLLNANKKYTEDTYNGYFYYKSNNQKISEHTFTAKFTYDGTLATCYDTDSTVLMIDHDSNLRPTAEDEGRYNLTPTQVYGYVTFVLYNTDDSVNSEATIKIYCNQDGETWVNRQG